jgi:hypothetical protein
MEALQQQVQEAKTQAQDPIILDGTRGEKDQLFQHYLLGVTHHQKMSLEVADHEEMQYCNVVGVKTNYPQVRYLARPGLVTPF